MFTISKFVIYLIVFSCVLFNYTKILNFLQKYFSTKTPRSIFVENHSACNKPDIAWLPTYNAVISNTTAYYHVTWFMACKIGTLYRPLNDHFAWAAGERCLYKCKFIGAWLFQQMQHLERDLSREISPYTNEIDTPYFYDILYYN